MLHGKLVFPWCPWQMEQFWPENKQITYFQIFLQHRTLVPLMGSNILTINYSVLGARELLAVPFQFSFFWNLPHQVKDRNVRKNIHCLIRLFEKGAIQIWSPHCETLYWGSTDKLCKWDSNKGEGAPKVYSILSICPVKLLDLDRVWKCVRRIQEILRWIFGPPAIFPGLYCLHSDLTKSNWCLEF